MSVLFIKQFFYFHIVLIGMYTNMYMFTQKINSIYFSNIYIISKDYYAV